MDIRPTNPATRRAEFDLSGLMGTPPVASAVPMTIGTAVDLMTVIWNIATQAQPDELAYLAWHVRQVSNNICHLDRVAEARRVPSGMADVA